MLYEYGYWYCLNCGRINGDTSIEKRYGFCGHNGCGGCFIVCWQAKYRLGDKFNTLHCSNCEYKFRCWTEK